MIAYPALSPDQSRQQFPRKLYDLLQNSNPAIVSWLVDGMSFYVQDEAQFCSTVLPVYFAHGKMSSFQRQLNIYGFKRLGPRVRERGARGPRHPPRALSASSGSRWRVDGTILERAALGLRARRSRTARARSLYLT